MNEFAYFLQEQLSPLGVIAIRRMFGCMCLFLHGKMIGIIDENNDVFIKKIMIEKTDVRFFYVRQGKVVYLDYVLIDDADELLMVIRCFLMGGIESKW